MIPIASTRQFINFAKNADKKGYNRRVKIEELGRMLDPDGRHIIYHNYLEGDTGIIRTTWFLKVLGDDEPVKAILDMDVKDFNRLARIPE